MSQALRTLMTGALIVLGVGCSGCSNSDSSSTSSGPAADTVQPKDTAPTDPGTPEASQWRAIRVRWTASEISEGACATGVFEFDRSGQFRSEKCGQIKSGQVAPPDLERLDAATQTVLGSLAAELACDGEEVMDYAEDVMVRKDDSSDYLTVFSFGSGPSCHRGQMEVAEAFGRSVAEIRGNYDRN